MTPILSFPVSQVEILLPTSQMTIQIKWYWWSSAQGLRQGTPCKFPSINLPKIRGPNKTAYLLLTECPSVRGQPGLLVSITKPSLSPQRMPASFFHRPHCCGHEKCGFWSQTAGTWIPASPLMGKFFKPSFLKIGKISQDKFVQPRKSFLQSFLRI